MADTLASMRDAVRDWANRRDITDAQIDRSINLAVTRMERSLRLPSMEGVTEMTLYFDPQVDPITYEPRFQLPIDFLEMKHLYYINGQGKKVDLQRRDLEWVLRHQDNTGDPCYFARHREFIEIAPAPPLTEDWNPTMVFYFEVPDLILDTDSNWFLNSAGGAVLYGSLVELFLFLRDQDEAALWEQKFQGETMAIQAHADGAEFAGSTLSIKNREYAA